MSAESAMIAGYTFADPALLERALTHSSWAHENGGEDNERLEFLGDSVLGLCTTLLLIERFPQAREGELSRLRSRLVNTRMLADIGRALGLGQQLRLGRGEEATGGREKDTLLENALEALLGAIWLDGGLEACRALVSGVLSPRVDALEGQERPGTGAWKDAKSRLQELTQAQWRRAPVYEETSREGPAHEPIFTVQVRLDERVLGVGQGRKLKDAEYAAARAALEQLGQEAT